MIAMSPEEARTESSRIFDEMEEQEDEEEKSDDD